MNIAKYIRSRAACELLEDDPAAGSEVTKEAPEGATVSPLPHDVSIVTPAEAPPHAGRELTVEWGAATDPNRAARSSQQDAAALMRLELAHPTDGALHVIAAGLFDGAGGHAAGEEASGMAATDILPGILSRVSTVADTAQVPDLLREQIWEANRRIFAGTSRWGGAATTLALALCLDGQWLGRHLWVAHIGDSRVYAVTPEGVVTAVTTDHSQVAALVQAGEITPEEALSHPDGNLITAALGAAPCRRPATFPICPSADRWPWSWSATGCGDRCCGRKRSGVWPSRASAPIWPRPFGASRPRRRLGGWWPTPSDWAATTTPRPSSCAWAAQIYRRLRTGAATGAPHDNMTIKQHCYQTGSTTTPC